MLDDKVLDALLCNSDVRELLCFIVEMSQSDFDENPLKQSYNAGKRSIGERIITEAKRVNFEAYLQMLREKNDRERANSR